MLHFSIAIPYSERLSFFPFYALLMVGAGLQLGPVTIGYEHRRDYPVVPYSFAADPPPEAGFWIRRAATIVVLSPLNFLNAHTLPPH
jgi:hypothetical protein